MGETGTEGTRPHGRGWYCTWRSRGGSHVNSVLSVSPPLIGEISTRKSRARLPGGEQREGCVCSSPPFARCSASLVGLAADPQQAPVTGRCAPFSGCGSMDKHARRTGGSGVRMAGREGGHVTQDNQHGAERNKSRRALGRRAFGAGTAALDCWAPRVSALSLGPTARKHRQTLRRHLFLYRPQPFLQPFPQPIPLFPHRGAHTLS